MAITRDRTLDIVKGLACLLMILAHPRTMHLTWDNDFTTFLWYTGFFAPVVFFASVGVSLRYQVNKRSKTEIILSNVLLLAFVFISQGFDFDSLFTSLTISSIAAVYLLRWNSVFLLIGIKLTDEFLNFSAVTYRSLHGTLFSVIPWVGFIFVGDYLHTNKKMRLPVFILCSAVALYLKLTGAALHDQSPTLFFVTVGLAIYSLLITIAPLLNRALYIRDLLSFLGGNTLLFWWVHFFLLKTVFSTGRLYAPLLWSLLFVSSMVMILILNKLNALSVAKISDRFLFWVVCLAVYVLVTFLPGTMAFYFGNFVLFLFAMNYHNFLPAVRKIREQIAHRTAKLPVSTSASTTTNADCPATYYQQ